MKNSTRSNIETADYSTICFNKGLGRQGSVEPIVGIISGATLIVLILVALVYYLIRSYRQKKIKMFLTDHRAKKLTRYFYADIKKITSNFSDKLGQGGYGSLSIAIQKSMGKILSMKWEL